MKPVEMTVNFKQTLLVLILYVSFLQFEYPVKNPEPSLAFVG